MLKDINPNGNAFPVVISNEGKDLLFYADDGIAWGLWTTDGTEDNTRLLKYLHLGIDGNSGVKVNDSIGVFFIKVKSTLQLKNQNQSEIMNFGGQIALRMKN